MDVKEKHTFYISVLVNTKIFHINLLEFLLKTKTFNKHSHIFLTMNKFQKRKVKVQILGLHPNLNPLAFRGKHQSKFNSRKANKITYPKKKSYKVQQIRDNVCIGIRLSIHQQHKIKGKARCPIRK